MKFSVDAFYKHFSGHMDDQYLDYGHGVRVLARDILSSNPGGPHISTRCTHNTFLPGDSLPNNFLLRHPNANVALTQMDKDAEYCRVQVVWLSTPEHHLVWVWVQSLFLLSRVSAHTFPCQPTRESRRTTMHAAPLLLAQ